MKRLILATAVVGVAFAVGVPRSTEAAYVATMQQVGSDVVVNGTGSINLAGLTVGPVYGAPNSSWMAPSYPALNMGGGSGSAVYLGSQLHRRVSARGVLFLLTLERVIS